MKSLNTGIVTLLNYGKHVPPAVSHVTLAHEIGHNFGSPHDPEQCTPGGEDGNFIMFARATSGDKRNNNRFSPCSLNAINPVLNTKARSSKGCFTEPQASLCGNGVVEEGEECDCGWEEDCRDSCCFPQRRYPPAEEKPCTLTPDAVCSPSQQGCEMKISRRLVGGRAKTLLKQKRTRKPQKCVSLENPFVVIVRETACQIVCASRTKVQKEYKRLNEVQGQESEEDSSYDWNSPPYDIPDMFAKPGTPCNDYNGYCDVFQKCREVDPSGPLATLRKLLLSDETLATFKRWIIDHWYAATLVLIATISLLTVHDRRKDYACDNCEKKFGQRSALSRHQRTIHEGRKDFALKVFEDYLCFNCGKKFGRKSNLLLHITTVHEGRKDYACDNCEKKFGQRSALLRHQRTIHEGRKDFALKVFKDHLCFNCGKKFGRKSNLLSHQKVVHEGRKDLTCDKCEKKFGHQSILRKHKKVVHEGRKDYACDKCEKKFGYVSHLKRHQTIAHEGHKNYACELCKKTFGLKTRLFRHRKIVHEGHKDFACNICEKKFGYKSHFLSHQKIVHEGRKDYECDICEKKFGHKQHLLTHQMTVHGGRKDFECDNAVRATGGSSEEARPPCHGSAIVTDSSHGRSNESHRQHGRSLEEPSADYPSAAATAAATEWSSRREGQVDERQSQPLVRGGQLGSGDGFRGDSSCAHGCSDRRQEEVVLSAAIDATAATIAAATTVTADAAAAAAQKERSDRLLGEASRAGGRTSATAGCAGSGGRLDERRADRRPGRARRRGHELVGRRHRPQEQGALLAAQLAHAPAAQEQVAARQLAGQSVALRQRGRAQIRRCAVSHCFDNYRFPVSSSSSSSRCIHIIFIHSLGKLCSYIMRQRTARRSSYNFMFRICYRQANSKRLTGSKSRSVGNLTGAAALAAAQAAATNAAATGTGASPNNTAAAAAATTTTKGNNNERVSLQVLYKPPFKFSWRLRRPDKATATTTTTTAAAAAAAKAAKAKAAKARPQRTGVLLRTIADRKAHKERKRKSKPSRASSKLSQASCIGEPANSDLHTVPSDLEVLLSESEFLFNDT
ncbi:unnamed protein product [Trichogramma brassicae]|uniref:ADAM10 endopeptidase n=1 Tax=Trichogramma brassicae TaxID=86971 RepID=A0A6H5ISU2_9HYME|nr:unnamed protein product [Trichogramma brassicae]